MRALPAGPPSQRRCVAHIWHRVSGPPVLSGDLAAPTSTLKYPSVGTKEKWQGEEREGWSWPHIVLVSVFPLSIPIVLKCAGSIFFLSYGGGKRSIDVGSK